MRFSTPGQIEGDSLRRQTAATEDYCKRHNLRLSDAFKLKDLGRSAFKGMHRSPTGALGQLEKQVRAGQIPRGTVLIVENLDRLSREDIVTAQLLLLNLINEGLEIVALSDNERAFSKTTLAANPMDLMVSIMVLSRAHEESRIKSYRGKESWRQRHKLAAEGKHIRTRLPCWLEAKDNRYVVIEKTAAIIKRMFDLYMQGFGTQSIATIFTAENVPQIAKKVQKRSNKWFSANVQRILKMKELIGFYCKVNPEVPNYFPALIKEEVFYAVQAKMKDRTYYKGQRTQRPNPFTGLLTCSHCGGSVVKQHASNRKMVSGVSKDYTYLQCANYRIKACKCSTTRLYSGISQCLLQMISATGENAFTTDDVAAVKTQNEEAALRGRFQEITEKMEKATQLFIENPSEAGTKILQQLECEKKGIDQQLQEIRNQSFLVDSRSNWKQLKTLLESEMAKKSPIPFRVIPLSVKNVNRTLEFIRHEEMDGERDLVALRENIRGIIRKIVIDLENLKVSIQYKNGNTRKGEIRQAPHYPRTFSYRLEGYLEWISATPHPTETKVVNSQQK